MNWKKTPPGCSRIHFYNLFRKYTRLSYYNVATRLVDLVGLCWFQVLTVDLIIFLVGVCWLEQNLSQQISSFKLMLGWVLTILALS